MAATKWEPISTFCLYSLKVQKQRRSTVCQNCQKKIPTDFICVFVSISDLAERKNIFVHAQANIHQIHLLHSNISSYYNKQHTFWDRFLFFVELYVGKDLQKATEFNPLNSTCRLRLQHFEIESDVDNRATTHSTLAVFGEDLLKEQDSNTIWMFSLPQHLTLSVRLNAKYLSIFKLDRLNVARVEGTIYSNQVFSSTSHW